MIKLGYSPTPSIVQTAPTPPGDFRFGHRIGTVDRNVTNRFVVATVLIGQDQLQRYHCAIKMFPRDFLLEIERQKPSFDAAAGRNRAS